MTDPRSVDFEHRVTVLEQAQLRTTEQLGNLAITLNRFGDKVDKNEQIRAKETLELRDQITDIVEGLTTQAKLELERKIGYEEGKNSITVRLPARQIAAIILGAAGLVATLLKLFDSVKDYL